MANHKSALKRARQNEVRRFRNKNFKTQVKNAVKEVRTTAASGSTASARESLNKAISIIQKSASKGIIHKKTASRKISRLSRLVNHTNAS